MILTDKILHAAVKKAVEVKLLPGAGFLVVAEEDCRKVKAVVEAALAEADESPPRAVPCVDHDVLDVIARAITPKFPFGRGGTLEGPTEDVTRERDSVEFREPATGRRFEVIVRPIPDAEDRP